jgi:hypothetical protein
MPRPVQEQVPLNCALERPLLGVSGQPGSAATTAATDASSAAVSIDHTVSSSAAVVAMRHYGVPMQKNIVERAFELARGGTCRTVVDIRRVLNREGFADPAGHLASRSLKTQLKVEIKGANKSADTVVGE